MQLGSDALPAAKEILSGINEPHWRKSHQEGILRAQSTSITSIIARVNKGSRKMYDRARRVLKPRILGIATALMYLVWVLEFDEEEVEAARGAVC